MNQLNTMMLSREHNNNSSYFLILVDNLLSTQQHSLFLALVEHLLSTNTATVDRGESRTYVVLYFHDIFMF